MTDCEVLANLHMIKLYMLSNLTEYHVKNLPQLPKLEARCVKLAFEEMRKDMEDDGLFDKMAEFFHPLTVTDDELTINKDTLTRFVNAQEEQKTQLEKELAELSDQRENQKKICEQSQIQLKVVTEKRKEHFEKWQIQKQTLSYRLVHDISEQWTENDLNLTEQLRKWRGKQAAHNALLKEIEDKYNAKEQLLKTIKDDLARPIKEKEKMDSRLCKPHRGFIMYGPPGKVFLILDDNIYRTYVLLGTGKSQIMKELAKKTGIAMLGPPLASGELDRPLVGQSEKVILDLCTRGHRLAHLMCCVCVDEIDALAPRRDEDASENRVARISVLLSVLEGIKDVPNLMFFAATNRLHMMDEAFLRRMTGKFFVGRPTYYARKRILGKIPPMIITPHIRNELAQVTTNFSGAALK